MVMIISMVALAYAAWYIIKILATVLFGNALCGIASKILHKPYKTKHYDFGGATRIPLKDFDKYTSKKYQKKFKSMQ